MNKKQIKKRRKTYFFLLSLPPLAALIMMGVLLTTNQAVVIAPEGVLLSPVRDTAPLILSLSLFVVGYLIFISLLFKESLKKIISKKILHK